MKGSLKRVFACAAAWCVFCFSLSGFMVYAEEGTTPVITISTPQDFADLSKNCVYDSYSRGMQVTLLNDIDMTDIDFEPMKIFCGTFEGGGHYITGLTLEFDGSQKGMCFELGEGGEIRNLNLSGCITASKAADASTSIDAIIGSVAKNAGINTSIVDEDSSISILGGIVGKNSGRIINCSFDGSLSGDGAVGGIAGQNESSGYIESCYNVGSISGQSDVGGIVGKNYGWIKASKNSGGVNYTPVEDCHNVGGICGYNIGVTEACSNDAVVGYKNVGTNIGGIAGNQSGCILECQNSGSIFGSKSVGGIFGRFEPYTEISVEDLDRVKDDLNELRENVKSDVNETWDNTINDVDDMRNRINTDINSIFDRFGIGSDSDGLFSGLYSLRDTRYALADSIETLTTSNSEVLNAIRDRINSGEGGSISTSAKEISDSLGGLSESATRLIDTLNDDVKVNIDDAMDSIDSTVDSINNVSGTLNTLLGDMDDILNNINDAYDSGDWESLSDSLGSLDERLDYIQDEILDPMSANVNSTLNSVIRAMNSLRSDSNYLTNGIVGPFREVETMLRNTRERIEEVNRAIDQVRTNIKEAIEKINGYIKGAVPTLKPDSIFGIISDKIFMTAYADELLTIDEDQLKDELNSITSVDLDLNRTVAGMETDNALVMYCYNSGEVSGQKNLGGIGGTVGIESAVKYGDNITLPGGSIITPTSFIKAVVDGCVSEGEVESREGYAGGVVGDAVFGIIKNTVTETNVNSEEGSHIGGIAGYSGGKIYNCAAISDMSGTQYVGGIAGSGKTISGCYALPRISGIVENSGAIAGAADGVVLNNYFIKEGLSGIDGADYNGKAVALESTEITGSDTIPGAMSGFTDDIWYMGSGDIFLPQNRTLSDNTAAYTGALLKAKSAEFALFRFKVKFVIDGETVYETTADYDTVLDQSIVPELEYRDGYCPQWSRDTTEPIRRNTVFTAEYVDAVRTLATSEEPPLLLAEGNFVDGSSVTAWETDITGDFPNGYRAVASYEFYISPDYSGKVRVHIRDKDENGNYIGVVVNGKTRILEAERDGSYLVFETEQQGAFTVLHKTSKLWLVGGITLLTLGLLLLIGALVYKRLNAEKSADLAKKEFSAAADKKSKKAAEHLAKKEAKAKAKAEIKEIKRRTREEINLKK